MIKSIADKHIITCLHSWLHAANVWVLARSVRDRFHRRTLDKCSLRAHGLSAVCIAANDDDDRVCTACFSIMCAHARIAFFYMPSKLHCSWMLLFFYRAFVFFADHLSRTAKFSMPWICWWQHFEFIRIGKFAIRSNGKKKQCIHANRQSSALIYWHRMCVCVRGRWVCLRALFSVGEIFTQ